MRGRAAVPDGSNPVGNGLAGLARAAIGLAAALFAATGLAVADSGAKTSSKPQAAEDGAASSAGAADGRKHPHPAAIYEEDIYLAIERHIDGSLGKYDIVWHLEVSDTAHIDVVPVPPAQDRPYWTLITVGMSYRPMTLPDSLKGQEAELGRAELAMLLPADWFGPGPNKAALANEKMAYPIAVLRRLARFPHERKSWLGPGHLYDWGGPIGPETELSALLVHAPAALPEAFHKLRFTDGEAINFYAVYPLYGAERDYTAAKGVNALLDAFEKAQVDLFAFDPKRPAVVRSTAKEGGGADTGANALTRWFKTLRGE